MSVQVRQAAPDDVHPIARLLLELGYEGSEPQLRRRLDRVLRHPDHIVLVAAEPPHGLVGLLHAGVQVTLTDPPLAEIGALVVSTAHRRSGIGRALVERLHAWTSRRGVEEVLVRLQMHRTEAQRFYEVLGYRAEKSQKVYRRSIAGPVPDGPTTLMD